MALALTTPSLLPTTSYADSPNTSVSEEDQYIKLDFYFKARNEEGQLVDFDDVYGENNFVYVNDVPYSFYYSDIRTTSLKRGSHIVFKLKKSDDTKADVIAMAEFNVPKVGYSDFDDITIETFPVSEYESDNKDNTSDTGISEENAELIEKAEKALYDADVTRKAVELLLETTPETVKDVADELNQLLDQQKAIIEKITNILNNLK